MDTSKNNPEDKKSVSQDASTYTLTAEGSLGILALGHVGIKAWRKKREEERSKNTQKNTNE